MQITMTAGERRATTEALKIARAKSTRGRPVLRTLQVKDGRAFVTDSYSLVVLPWLDGLADGCYDADDLNAALKGAGREAARITVTDDAVTVSRFEPLQGIDLDDHPEDLGTSLRGVFPVDTVEGTPVNAAPIFDDAVAATEADDYVPEVSHFNPDQLAQVFRCHPSHFERRNVPVAVLPRGLKPAVVANGVPFAVQMPMRVG